MHVYEIDGDTYYVANDRLYAVSGDEHEIEEIDDHPIHLYEIGDRPVLARLEYGGDIYSSVRIETLGDNVPASRTISAAAFDGAVPVEPVLPADVYECPGCGGWAGTKRRNDKPRCVTCGHGISGEA